MFWLTLLTYYSFLPLNQECQCRGETEMTTCWSRALQICCNVAALTLSGRSNADPSGSPDSFFSWATTLCSCSSLSVILSPETPNISAKFYGTEQRVTMSNNTRVTNIQFFFRSDALPIAQPTVSKHWREKYRIPWTCLPQAHLGVFQLCLWPLIAPGYLGEGCHASHQPSDASTS